MKSIYVMQGRLSIKHILSCRGGLWEIGDLRRLGVGWVKAVANVNFKT